MDQNTNDNTIDKEKIDEFLFNLENDSNGVNKKKAVNRHEKSEKEKDEEMLLETCGKDSADDAVSDRNYFRFEATPWYVKNGEMRDYQVRGLNWLIQLYVNKTNGILADEMGLGKTLQTISMLGYLKHYTSGESRFLIITPKSTLQNWINECNKWVPSLTVQALIGDQEERNQLKKNAILPGDWNVMVTTYEIVIREKALLKKFSWKYLAIDEAHRIKNEKSKLSEIVRQFDSKNRLLITGTPLQNNLHELWALLNFLMPKKFDSADSFDEMFNLETMEQQNLVHRLHRILKPFILRRLKSEVEKRLPPKKEIKVYIGLSELQRSLYTKILMKDIDAVNGSVKQAEKNRLQNILMQLRKCTNHPYLFDGVEEGPPYTTDEHIVQNCGKMVLLNKLLDRLKEQKSRVLLFTQMTSMLDILEDYCRWKGHEYCRLDGQTAHCDRQKSIDEYNEPNSTKFIFMLSTRAGGLGINLTSADVVIIYDSDWNPQMDLQAQDRAHRIGQTKTVKIFRLITENTIEEKIIARAEKKLLLDSVVIQQGRLIDNKSNQLDKSDMMDMIKFGANFIFRSNNGSNLDDDIDALLARGEEKTMKLNQQLALQQDSQSGMGQLTFDTNDNISVYTFEGENYKEKQVLKRDAEDLLWIGPAKRKRTAANYTIDHFTDDVKNDPDVYIPKDVKNSKLNKIQYYQFPSQRLTELINKEELYYKKSIGYKIPKSDEQKKIKDAEPLTEEEIKEKEILIQQSFTEWNKKDFFQFIRANEEFGRHNMDKIASSVKSKTTEEVKQYAAVFWQRFTDIPDHARYLKQIEKAEQKLEQRQLLKEMLQLKMKKYTNPETQLKIYYNGNKGRYYSEEEDRFLIFNLYKLNMCSKNVYQKLVKLIRSNNMFRMNWYFRSRSPADLQRRCNTLLNFIDREMTREHQRIQNNELNNNNSKIEMDKENCVTISSDSDTISMRGDVNEN